ncbi:MAG: M48 family metalloprotease [Polyangiaceae bacterium]
MHLLGSVRFWTLGVFFVGAFVLTAFPGWLILRLGDYGRHHHWTHNARHVTMMRTLVLMQYYALTILPLPPLCAFRHVLFARISVLVATTFGWYVANYVLGSVLGREHVFPKPVVWFEGERAAVLQLIHWLSLFGPLVTFGLELKYRISASVLAIGLKIVSIGATTTLLRVLGLLEPLPEFLVSTIDRAAPGVSAFALRSAAPNAAANSRDRTIFVTTGALQCLTPAGLKAVVAHELEHLKEPRTATWRRSFLGLFGTACSVTITLAAPHKLIGWMAVLVVLYALLASLLSKSSLAAERIADRAGRQAEETDGDYARALLALHEAFLVSPTMPGRRSHPDLYERLVKAGAKPDFPKSAPPLSVGLLWMVAFCLLSVLVLAVACLRP